MSPSSWTPPKLRLLAALALALMLASAQAPADDLAGVSPGPHAVVSPLRLTDVRWTEGFWADRLEVCRQRSLPAMWEIMRGDEYKPYLQHFLIAAGEMEGEYHGAPFNDGDFYKFLEAVVALSSQSPTPELEQILEQSIDAIARAQRDDGYLHTPVLIARKNGDRSAEPFQDRHNFEMYNLGHLLTAACLHHRITGDDRFLAVARRAADFLVDVFRRPTSELARNSICPSHYMGVIDLYRSTGDQRYLELARRFFEMRSLVENGGDDNQDRIPFFEQREAVGHAVRANYLYAGAADLLLETGDARLRAPLSAAWENVVRRKMYITGACGALYDGASPYGARDQSSITRVHQAYGHDYQLPNTTAHGETCAAIGSVLWNWRMFLATGEPRYVDVLERTLYNAVLAGVSLDGTDYFYVNPLRIVDPLPTPLRWSRMRTPFVTSYCCPPNVLRTLAGAHQFVYGRSPEAVWINLYGGAVCETTMFDEPLRLVQTTSYPWDGRVRMDVEQCPDAAFAVKLRIPQWADSAELSVNGRPVAGGVVPGTYAVIRRAWRPGDVIELNLSMPARLIEAHPLVEEARNQVAIQRGPIVYCLESTDLPEDVHVQDVVIPSDAELTPRHETKLLGGVTTIETVVLAREAIDWENALYRPRVAGATKEHHIRLIPYHAWANRGESEMSVWLPVK